MNMAGVFSDSIVTREAAGWMRCVSESQSSRCEPGSPFSTATSPSIRHGSGSSRANASTSSGKYRVSGFAPRLPISTVSPSHDTSPRNPSHFGSKLRPPGVWDGSGMSGMDFASIGAGMS